MPKKITSKNYFKELKALLPFANANFTHISVAAVVVTDKGVFKGVNYEDSVCSLSSCAERNAMLSAVTHGMKELYEIHILSNISNMTMCGACRQMASSFGTTNTKVFDYDLRTGNRQETTLGQLVPKATLLAKNIKK